MNDKRTIIKKGMEKNRIIKMSEVYWYQGLFMFKD